MKFQVTFTEIVLLSSQKMKVTKGNSTDILVHYERKMENQFRKQYQFLVQ